MEKRFKYLHLALLGTYSIFILDYFSLYLSDKIIPAVDIPGHVELIKEVLEQLYRGRIFFYEINNFSGWQAQSYYGPLPHIFAAILSVPLSLFTQHSVELAVHLVLVIGSALFPWALYFASKPLAFSLASSDTPRERVNVVLTLLVISFSFVFFNIDGEFIGIGAPAIFQTGLYAQMFGWLLFLLHLGFLYRFLENGSRKNLILLGGSFSLLLLSHPLSASFCLMTATLLAIFYRKYWKKLFINYSLSVLITSFWLLPFLLFSKNHTINYTHLSSENFLSYLLHYPPISLLLALLESFSGTIPFLNISFLFIQLLLLACFLNKKLWKSKLWASLALSILVIATLISGGFVQEALPGGIHFARYHGYLLLLAMHLLLVVPFAFNIKKDFTFCNVCLACFIAIINTYLLPSENYLRFESHPPFEVLEPQNKVLEYFKNHKEKGRVLFEYFIDPRKFHFITPHFIPSKLHRETGFESQNGLFIQSSLAYHHIATAAVLNDIPTYHEDLNLGDFYRPDESTAIELMSFFGTSHVVLTNEKLFEELRPLVKNSISIEPYKILELNTDSRKINYSSKTLIGYLDLNRSLAFSDFELYFFANKILGPRFDLIELDTDKPIPNELSLVLINSNKENLAQLNEDFNKTKKMIFNWKGDAHSNHYQPIARDKKKNFQELRYYLNNRLKLPKNLLHFRKQRVKIIEQSPTISFNKNTQEFALSNLLRNKLVRINYSYAPFLTSNDGTIYRGLGERIYFLPKNSSATLTYNAQSHWSHILGLIISFLAFWTFLAISKK